MATTALGTINSTTPIYTGAQADAQFVPLAGGTITGAVTHTGSANNKAVENKILFTATVDATETELTTDGAAGSGATNRIAIPADTTMSVVVNICARSQSGTNNKQFLRQFLIRNVAGTVSLVGSVTTLGTDIGSLGASSWLVTITANDTDDCIKITGTGAGLTNIRWTAYVVSSETTYA